MASKSEPPKDRSRGKNGGKAVREKYGVEFFREIGRKGGQSLKERGDDYAELGRIGGDDLQVAPLPER